MRGPVSRSRPLGGLAVADGAFVGALGLEREVAFGVAHGVVGRPDVAAALPADGAGLQLVLREPHEAVKLERWIGVCDQLPVRYLRELGADIPFEDTAFLDHCVVCR